MRIDGSGAASLSIYVDSPPPRGEGCGDLESTSQPRQPRSPSMIRHRVIPAAQVEQDRSMRVVEYAMAIVAIVVAGVLALAR
jgi:hypothetical protein